MAKQKFAAGSLVKINKRSRTAENRDRVKDLTYGTINSTFEVVSFMPGFTIQGESSPDAYWITPVNKTHSTICMYADELFAARKRKSSAVEEDDLSFLDLDMDSVELLTY